MGKMAVAPKNCILEQNFQLPTPLKFGSPHESVLEQRFSFYPTSHLCVVLHFLIFLVCSVNEKFSYTSLKLNDGNVWTLEWLYLLFKNLYQQIQGIVSQLKRHIIRVFQSERFFNIFAFVKAWHLIR